MTKKLIKNQWKCLYCGDVIESKHQHDYATKIGLKSVVVYYDVGGE